MRKTRQFHPTRYDLLEERLVLSRVTIAASPPPGNTQTINPKLIVTPLRIQTVTNGVISALETFANRVDVSMGAVRAGRMKPAQFNKYLAGQLGILSTQFRTQAARLPFGARDLYPRLQQNALLFANNLAADGGRNTAGLLYFYTDSSRGKVEIYVQEGFASGKFYDSTKVHWTH